MLAHYPRKSILIAVSAFLLAAGLAVWLGTAHQKQSTGPEVPNLKGVITHTTNKPSEQPIKTAAYKSTETGSEPNYMTLPAIKAQGYIEKVGVDQNNQMASPNNVNLAGWYVNSLEPGQPGLSIIDGHIDGYTGIGIFYRLSKLVPGNQFYVQLANGTNLTYIVVKVTTVKVANVSAVLFAQDPSIKSQLNLVTCGGSFDHSTRQYDDRTIVVARLASSSPQ